VDMVQSVENGMPGRKVDDRKLGGRKDLGDLTSPGVPRPTAPEVVHPQESPLLEVAAQTLGLLRVEADGPDIGHEDERACEELVFHDPDDAVVGLAVRRLSDGCLGELGETQHEVPIRVGVVGPPTLAQRLAAHLPVGNAAKREGALIEGEEGLAGVGRTPEEGLAEVGRTPHGPHDGGGVEQGLHQANVPRSAPRCQSHRGRPNATVLVTGCGPGACPE